MQLFILRWKFDSKRQLCLTSAHVPAAPLRGGIPALAVCAAVGRPGVGAVAEAPVDTLGRARRPRRPLCPSARGSWSKDTFSNFYAIFMNYDLNLIVSTFISWDHVLIETGLVARFQRKMSSIIYRSFNGCFIGKDHSVMDQWKSDNLIIIVTIARLHHNLDHHLFPSDLGSAARKTVSFSPLAWPLTRIPPRLVPPPSLGQYMSCQPLRKSWTREPFPLSSKNYKLIL